MALADFYGQVDELVRDRESVIKPIARDRALEAAAQRYSVDRPRELVEDVLSAGGFFLALPLAWQAGFSRLLSIELDFTTNVLRVIEGSQCAIYVSPTGTQIRLQDGFAQDAGTNLRVRFTAAHQISIATDTIPLPQRYAVCCYAASVLCGELASHYAGDSDSTIQADSVDHRNKSQTWAARASALRTEYFKVLGVDSAVRIEPAQGQVSFSQRERFPRQRLGGLL